MNILINITKGGGLTIIPMPHLFFTLLTLHYKVLLITYKLNNHGNKKQNQTFF